MRIHIATTFLPLAAATLYAGAACAQAPPQPSAGPELTGTLPWATSPAGVQSITIQIGDGGSGPYKAVLKGDPNLKTHTLYRPRDLKPFGTQLRLPVVVYGNGACRNASNEVRNFLTEIASHGFLVIAIGPALASATGGALVTGGTKSEQLLEGADWAAAENARQGSEYFGKVDATKIAAMGQSCGGLQAMEVSADSRIATTVMLNSGVLPANFGGAGRGAPPAGAPPEGPGRGGRAMSGMPAVSKDQLAKLHAPVLYLIGGKSDIAYPNAADDFARIEKVPVFMGNREVGHYPATYLEPRGGAFGVAASAWLKWQLKGDQAAARMFTGDKCGICSDPQWTVERKNMR